MASKSDSEHIVSFLAARNHSSRALTLGLVALLLCAAGSSGYFLVQFRNVRLASVAHTEDAANRSSLLFHSSQQVIEAYNLANRVVAKNAPRDSVRIAYKQKIDSCRELRSEYLKSLEGDQPDCIIIKPAAALFLSSIDSLVACTDAVFSSQGRFAGVSSIPERFRLVFEANATDFFSRFRQARDAVILREMEANILGERRGSDLTKVMGRRYFVVSLVVFLVACALSIIVVVLAGRSNALIDRLKMLVANSASPLQVTDPDGKVLYVNAAFENRYGARSLKSGTPGLSVGICLADIEKSDDMSWEKVRSTLEQHDTWSGEAQLSLEGGARSFASVIIFPAFDKRNRLQEAVWVFQDITEKRQLVLELEETKTRYRKLVENSRDGIIVAQGQRLVFVNPAALKIFGYESEAEMKRLQLTDIVAAPSRPFLQFDYAKIKVGEDVISNHEMKGLTKSAVLVDLELDARIILWDEEKALYASFRDISARKALERQQAVWLWEQETLRTIDHHLLGIVDLQKVLDVILQQVSVLTHAQFIGVVMVDVANRQAYWRAVVGNRSVVSGSVLPSMQQIQPILNSRGPVVIDDVHSDEATSLSQVFAVDGEGIVSCALFPIAVNSESRGIMVVGFRQPHQFIEKETRILTSMKERLSIAIASGELYENLVKREKELQLLSGARAEAQEEERRRISREIHDGLGQLLTAIKLNLEMLEDDVPESVDATKRIGEVKQLLDNVLQEAREISYNLMPSVLDDFGLGPGLQSLCEQFSKRTGLKISFHEHGLTDRMSPNVEIGVYRIAQEALNNIAKHAEAKKVSVQIVRKENTLQMTVEDDGKGMEGGVPLAKPTTSGGTGLVSMRERASSFGGTLVVDSSLGKGTVISVEIPVSGD